MWKQQQQQPQQWQQQIQHQQQYVYVLLHFVFLAISRMKISSKLVFASGVWYDTFTFDRACCYMYGVYWPRKGIHLSRIVFHFVSFCFGFYCGVFKDKNSSSETEKVFVLHSTCTLVFFLFIWQLLRERIIKCCIASCCFVSLSCLFLCIKRQKLLIETKKKNSALCPYSCTWFWFCPRRN